MMSASIYDNELVEPNDQMLGIDLASTKIYFDKICEFIELNYGDLRLE